MAWERCKEKTGEKYNSDVEGVTRTCHLGVRSASPNPTRARVPTPRSALRALLSLSARSLFPFYEHVGSRFLKMQLSMP